MSSIKDSMEKQFYSVGMDGEHLFYKYLTEEKVADLNAAGYDLYRTSHVEEMWVKYCEGEE